MRFYSELWSEKFFAVSDDGKKVSFENYLQPILFLKQFPY